MVVLVYKLVVLQPTGGLEVLTELSDTSNDDRIMYIKDDLAEHKIGEFPKIILDGATLFKDVIMSGL